MIEGLVLSGLVMTCDACPSQWEAQDQHGHKIYARYRWGHLTVTRSDAPSNELKDALVGTQIYEGYHGDGLDGWMTTEVMLIKTGMIMQ